jgi:hypothetical protein
MQNGVIFRSMVDHESALEVSTVQLHWGKRSVAANRRSITVDFALTEVAYTVVSLIQEFQTIKLPKGEPVVLAGLEKQTMTLVMSSTAGCKAELR